MSTMVHVSILEILKTQSSENAPLTQTRIEAILQNQYGMTVHRNVVSNHVRKLLEEFPNNIEVMKKTRTAKNGEQQTMIVGLWWVSDYEFEPSEVRYLADAVVASASLPIKQKQDLIRKIAKMNDTVDLRALAQTATPEPTMLTRGSQINSDLMLTIEVLGEAIANNQRVSFSWCEFDKHSNLIPVSEETPTTVDPRQLAFNNGHYYLLATYPKSEKIYHFRIDLIRDPNIVEENGKPVKASARVKKQEENLSKYMGTHPMMFGGESKIVRIRVKNNRGARLRVFEMFGTTARYVDETPETLDYEVSGNLDAVRYWIKQNSENITAIAPKELREALAVDAKAMLEEYTSK